VAFPDEQIDWRAFKRRIQRAKTQVQQQVLAVDGPIAAFGATAKATTLLHHFGLTDSLAYCVDSTPAKQGRYLPGTTIPICDPSRLRDDPPAAVLLTAWNFESVIRAQFPDLHFIVPFKEHTV
jgi:hypothetical protein